MTFLGLNLNYRKTCGKFISPVMGDRSPIPTLYDQRGTVYETRYSNDRNLNINCECNPTYFYTPPPPQ